MKRIFFTAAAVLLCAAMLASCTPSGAGGVTTDENGNVISNNGGGGGGGEQLTDPTGRYTNFDLRSTYDAAEAVKITFSETAATVEGKGADADGTTVSITRDGTYILTGSCSDGRIIVEVPTTDKVQLVFAGLKLTCKTSAAVWIKSCDKTSITLADGTVNSLADAAAYTDANADGEPNACLFSKDDLTINGTGTLEVTSVVNNGITTKDDLKIVSGTIKVTAQNHGIRGNDSVTIRDGNITIVCKNDGIKSSQEEKADKGYIYIEGGTISIDSGDDCLQAPREITVTGGSITTKPGGKQTNCDGTVTIADGVIK